MATLKEKLVAELQTYLQQTRVNLGATTMKGVDLRLSGVDDSNVLECEYYKPDVCNPENGIPCSQIENCEDAHGRDPPGLRHACYVAWTNDTAKGVTVMLKGCWLAQDIPPFNCGDSECVAYSSASPSFEGEDSVPTAYFCCCNKSKCNDRFFYRPKPPSSSLKPTDATRPISSSTDVTASLVYAFAPICLLALLIILCYWVYRRYKLRCTVKRMAQNGEAGLPMKIPPSPSDASKNIELIEIVAKGRYGNVWKARSNDQFLAVKVFPAQDVNSWVQEQDIYSIPGMKNHPNILRFLGAEYRGNGGVHVEYWLITAYQEHGSLQDYLKTHTISLTEMLRISTTMLCGLAYLHEETSPTGDQQLYKPTIVHRDFKSRNVLLKNGLIACIADFGLAKCVQGRTLNEVHTQVGTRRYMSPEVLEGATEFSAFAFRQIDVYAAALVLWEIISRCSFVGEKPDEYRLPLEEAGARPSLEELQNHVVVQKKRPVIKKLWQQHVIGAVMCSTIEEMWDAEPEARVTAGCALERFSALESASKGAVPIFPSVHSSPYPNDGGIAGKTVIAEMAPLIVPEMPFLVETKIV